MGFFERAGNAITWNNIVKLFKFFNVVDNNTGSLSPPKILAWGLSVGIIVVMFQINDEEIDLAMFAGAIMTLISAFGIAYKLGEGKKVKLPHFEEEDEHEYRPRHHDRPYGMETPEEEVKP